MDSYFNPFVASTTSKLMRRAGSAAVAAAFAFAAQIAQAGQIGQTLQAQAAPLIVAQVATPASPTSFAMVGSAPNASGTSGTSGTGGTGGTSGVMMAQASAPTAATGAPAPSGGTSTAAAPAPSNAQQQLPLNVQGAASLGLTVRVKDILLGPDATILTVSASFSSRMTHSTDLASTDTFLELPGGVRLPIKRPENNRYLSIKDGETMQGQLVFLGAVPLSATEVRLIFNEGNAPDDSIGPGLAMTLPLQAPPAR